MTITLNQLKKIIRETTPTPYDSDREFKFQTFLLVCDGLLKDGKITAKQHKRWTNIY